ncbi:MAG: radical SAM protein [Candidatus Aenigmatarchaeota archaeon]
MRRFENVIENYFLILKQKSKPKFFSANLEKLLEEANEIIKSCELCERKCKIERNKTKGFCRAPNKIMISSEFLHYGEESFLVPSHTIFFMGCNFHCVYCQNWAISNWIEEGIEVSPRELAIIIRNRFREGAKNVNFVGGEPTPYLPFILEILANLKKLKVPIPIVWNSNFYMSVKSMEILNEVIDLFLPDFKYGNNRCARRLSKVEKYFEVVTRNLKLAKGEICIRHLILPNHIYCCSYKIIKWIARNLKEKCIVNIMDQYYPTFEAYNYNEINRRITTEEYNKVVELANKLDVCILE